MKINSYLKNTMMLLMELEAKSEKYAVMNMIMKKITWKLNSDDDLPLNKPLNVYLMTITIRSVFKEDGKVYPHVFLDDTGHFSGQLLQENDLSSLLLK